MTTPDVTRPLFTHRLDFPMRWERRSLQGRLDYTSADPYAVTFTITDQRQHKALTREWLLARDLLRDGCTRPVGEGDVHIRPAGNNRVLITISSPVSNPKGGGEITLDVSKMLVLAFASRIYLAVPAGREQEWVTPMDDELAELLAVNEEGERA